MPRTQRYADAKITEKTVLRTGGAIYESESNKTSSTSESQLCKQRERNTVVRRKMTLKGE